MELIYELGKKIWLAQVELTELHEQDINPNTMPETMFNQLSSNIKKRGILESLPYCCQTEKGIEIISGHHRVRSAKKAGLKTIYILLDKNKLTRDEIIAKQLAHNNIDGLIDPTLTLRLFQSIHDIDSQIEAYVNTDELMKQIATEAASINEIKIDFEMKTITMLFLPHQIENLTKAVDETIKRLSGDEKTIYLSNIEYFEQFKKALNTVRKMEEIKNIGFALNKMSSMILEFYKDKPEKKLNKKRGVK